MVGNIIHSGFISSVKYDNLTPWYTTMQANEVITFKDDKGNPISVNSLFIEANTTDLYIRILPSDGCLYIPSNDSKSFDLKSVREIQVMGASGQNIRWSGMTY
jgi:hypothetical protein